MKMPPPIATKFTKLVLTILAITILGIILSFVSQDHTLLMLSAGVAVAGGVKIIDYYRTIKGEHYECIEGTLVREQAGYARKRHMIVLALEDGSLEQRILEGRYKLKIGTDSESLPDTPGHFGTRLEPTIASISSGNRSPRSRLNSQKSSSRPSSSLVMKSCLFRQESRFRYSGRVPKRMICLLCSLLD